MTARALASTLALPLMLGLLAGPLAACGGDDDGPAAPSDDSGGDDDDGDGAAGDADAGPLDTWTAPTSWLAHGDRVEVLNYAGTTTVSGDVSGAELVDPAWGAQPAVFCWNAVQGPEWFAGEQRYYALGGPLEQLETLEVVLTPDAGADLNLAVVEYPLDSFLLPPDVPGARDCDVSTAAGAGEAETVTVSATQQAVNILVVVSAPTPGAGGGFTLTLTESGGIPGGGT